MKEEKKELIIVPCLGGISESPFTTAKILYNNYEIGTCQFDAGIALPPLGSGVGVSYNTQYNYTLIFNDKGCEPSQSLNIALNSISTNGFYQLIGGILVSKSNLKVPVGTYKNIGLSPEGIKYNLELITDTSESKIILSRIC